MEGGRGEGFLTTTGDGGIITVKGAYEYPRRKGTVDQLSLIASACHRLEEDSSLTRSKCSRRTNS